MDDFDSRLRSRLIALAHAAIQSEDAPSIRQHASRAKMRTGLPAGALVVAVISVIAITLLARFGAQIGPGSNASAPFATGPMTASSQRTSTRSPSVIPSGGISAQRAIELSSARTSFGTLVSAEAGRFEDVNKNPSVGPGFPIKTDQWVWAVTYQGDMTICNPTGYCDSPRPGSITVFLDYFTGDFLASTGLSPSR